jgi:CheY-like chemotaxis protein
MIEETAQLSPEQRQQEKLIFIIEDDLDLAGILMDFLREYSPFRVIWSNSGPAALKAMRHIQPDLLVIDYLLPSINGLEFYDLVGKRPEYAHIPSILITANPQRVGLEAEQRRIRVLEKPFDLDMFLDIINTLLT